MIGLVLVTHGRLAAEFAAAAQTSGVKLTPGAAFAMDHTAPRSVRICLGPAPTGEILRDGRN